MKQFQRQSSHGNIKLTFKDDPIPPTPSELSKTIQTRTHHLADFQTRSHQAHIKRIFKDDPITHTSSGLSKTIQSRKSQADFQRQSHHAHISKRTFKDDESVNDIHSFIYWFIRTNSHHNWCWTSPIVYPHCLLFSTSILSSAYVCTIKSFSAWVVLVLWQDEDPRLVSYGFNHHVLRSIMCLYIYILST